jgi:hypothetical protein
MPWQRALNQPRFAPLDSIFEGQLPELRKKNGKVGADPIGKRA